MDQWKFLAQSGTSFKFCPFIQTFAFSNQSFATCLYIIGAVLYLYSNRKDKSLFTRKRVGCKQLILDCVYTCLICRLSYYTVLSSSFLMFTNINGLKRAFNDLKLSVITHCIESRPSNFLKDDYHLERKNSQIPICYLSAFIVGMPCFARVIDLTLKIHCSSESAGTESRKKEVSLVSD